MNAWSLLEAFDAVDERYIFQAKEPRRPSRARRTALLVAAAVAAILLCGFAAYELGFFDPWIQTPSTAPTETVRSAIEGELSKDYTVAVRIDELSVDEGETRRMAARYADSDLARARGWTDEYLASHFLAVRAKYHVEYDHTRTFLPDGDVDRYFYLTEDADGRWRIVDNSTDGQPLAD